MYKPKNSLVDEGSSFEKRVPSHRTYNLEKISNIVNQTVKRYPVLRCYPKSIGTLQTHPHLEKRSKKFLDFFGRKIVPILIDYSKSIFRPVSDFMAS